ALTPFVLISYSQQYDAHQDLHSFPTRRSSDLLEAGSRRNEPAHNHVFLQAAKLVHRAADRSFGQDAGRLLEGGGGDERVRGEGSLGDAEQQRPARGGLPATRDGALVLLPEPELVHLLVEEELGVAH